MFLKRPARIYPSRRLSLRATARLTQIAAVAGVAECSQVKARESSPGVLDAEDLTRSLAALQEAGYRGRLSLVYAGSDDDEWGRLDELYEIVRSAL